MRQPDAGPFLRGNPDALPVARQKAFHISDVQHACEKDSQGGDYWVKRMMKAGLVVKRGRDQHEIANVGSFDPEWPEPDPPVVGHVGM